MITTTARISGLILLLENKQYRIRALKELDEIVEDITEARPQSQAQMDSDDRFYAELESQPEGENEEADLWDGRDRF